MKATHYIYIAAVALLTTACEVISESDRLIPLQIEASPKTALLIDFSALNCINCPTAAEEAHQLLQQYGDQLIVIEAHPATNSLTRPPVPEYDYTCPAADTLYIAMGGTNVTPLPTGVIDMKQQANGDFFRPYQEWGTAVMQAIRQNDSVDIQISVSDNGSNITYAVTNHSAVDKTCILYMWLTEDHVISAQLLPDGSDTEEYDRNHLLRDAILPPGGIQVDIKAHRTIDNSITYNLPGNVLPENCNVIAAIYCNKQIIQAAQTQLMSN